MDTSRIVINTIDNSSTPIEESTAVTGFTVVRAPKGPKTPIKLSAGSTARIKDIFGEASADYPELFEVETFNKEYDLWVSAPYIESENDVVKTKVPVAYLTPNGVFASDDPIPYTETLEKLISGDSYITGIEGVDTFTDSVTFLADTRYPKDVFNASIESNVSDKYPGYTTYQVSGSVKSCLVINTGLTKSQIQGDNAVDPKLYPASQSKALFKVHGYSTNFSSNFYFKFAGTSGIVFDNSSSQESIGLIAKKDEDGTFSDTFGDNDNLYILIYGSTDSNSGAITQDYISKYLDQEEERENLLTYWKLTYTAEELKDSDIIRGVILPKYPSDRDLYIDFTSFSDLNGYSKKSYKSRNILKMSVYEDGAFHNANHKLDISGSIDPKAVNASGYSIGFSDSNSTYSNQDLIFVYGKKPFTKEDEDGLSFNTYLSKYPAIKLFGGEKCTDIKEVTEVQTDITSIDFHNIGWEMALDNEYSDVDIFFDSAVHEYSTATTGWTGDTPTALKASYFFDLASSDKDYHKLAGYIFNLTPDAIPSDKSLHLTFGRNYWNVCNLAVTDLSNGDRIFSPMTGARALMQARIIENRWGGIAPMWENQGTPSMGGQLSMISPYRLKYKYSKADMDAYDLYNYNPVINDRQYGVMVVGQKTCKEGDVTDWSYIGHASAFLNFLKVVRNNVMIPQIGKANNSYYRTLRKEQVERYLEERISGNNRIWAEASVDTSTADGVNDIYALKARKFVINVSVKVDVFSEKVELNFTNEDQATSVSAAE